MAPAHAPGVTLGRSPIRRALPGEDGEYSAIAKLTHDGACAGAGQRPCASAIGTLHVDCRPRAGDRLHRAAIGDRTRALKFAFKASDDYGVDLGARW